MSKWKPPPPAMLSVHCAGPFSEPSPTKCDKSMSLLMPFNHEHLIKAAKHAGFFVTAVSPPGVNPPECVVLCRDCALLLIPEMVEATEKVWAGGFGAGKEKGS